MLSHLQEKEGMVREEDLEVGLEVVQADDLVDVAVVEVEVGLVQGVEIGLEVDLVLQVEILAIDLIVVLIEGLGSFLFFKLRKNKNYNSLSFLCINALTCFWNSFVINLVSSNKYFCARIGNKLDAVSFLSYDPSVLNIPQ